MSSTLMFLLPSVIENMTSYELAYLPGILTTSSQLVHTAQFEPKHHTQNTSWNNMRFSHILCYLSLQGILWFCNLTHYWKRKHQLFTNIKLTFMFIMCNILHSCVTTQTSENASIQFNWFILFSQTTDIEYVLYTHIYI
jgi:hypothetical protein